MAHVDPTHAGDLHFDVGQDRADSHVVVKLAAVGAAQQVIRIRAVDLLDAALCRHREAGSPD
jgi:hypothetical protein